MCVVYLNLQGEEGDKQTGVGVYAWAQEKT